MSANPAMSFRQAASSVAFKQGMRALAGAVCVVVADGPEGEPLGLTATAVTSLSADPPSLLVCVNRSASIASALAPKASFTVNVLSANQQDVAQAFGGQRVAKGVARFAFGGWVRAKSEALLLSGANVAFECTVAQVSDWATHHIVIGEVVDVHLANPQHPALIYHDGHYKSLG